MRYLIAVLATVLLATACSSAQHHPPQPRAHAAATPATVAYSDTQACAAFRQATTIGAPSGQNTLAWLLSQDERAAPELKAALERFVNAWNDPMNVKGIHRAQRAVARLCG